MDTGNSSILSEPFCHGPGYVMNSGFQTAVHNYCVLFLFEGANVDTPTKYVFALLGAFLMSFANEIIRWARSHTALGTFRFTRNLSETSLDVLLGTLFAVQMVDAYFIMLLVMLYEFVFFITIILGLGVGHVVTRRLDRKFASRSAGSETGRRKETSLEASTSPCCGGSYQPIINST